MIKRTIEVSGPDTHLSIRNAQVIVQRNGEQIGQVPAEDIGMLIVDSPTTVYTHGTLVELLEHGAAVLLCGANHLPTGQVIPLAANYLQTERMAAQVTAPVPLKKNLWRQIVRAKIRNQARNFPPDHEMRQRLLQIVPRVRSGDPENNEAHAARHYWSAWLGGEHEFHRHREGPPPNNLLNYGYAVLRAATARALAGAGLHPSISLQHHSRYDAFCLADDMMEPLRPLVDRAVREIFLAGMDEINTEAKRNLLSLLLEKVHIQNAEGPLFVELEKMAFSLVQCYNKCSKRLEIPILMD